MTESPYASGDENDLPRTVRQQKEARARDQLAREMLNAPRPAYAREAKAAAAQRADAMAVAQAQPTMSFVTEGAHGAELAQSLPPGYAAPTVVTRFKVPFFHLVLFFLKCVIAGIPAMLLAGAILYGIGQLAQTYLPWLIKMRILITFPG